MAENAISNFNGLARKRTIRAVVNPMDKSTVVSIFPKEFTYRSPTTTPASYFISAGSIERPSVLVVGSSSWWREIDEEQPLLEITNSSIQVADAIVKGYCSGLIACDMSSAMPGIFFVPGEFTVQIIQAKYQKLLDKAKFNQDNWYKAVVKMADTFWAKSNGNPITIGDDMRMAAKALNLTNKDWMADFTMMENIRCAACGSPRNPNYPVCPNCHAIVDPEKAKNLNIKFAE